MHLRHRGPAAASLLLGLALLLAGRASLAQLPICAGDATPNKSAPNQTHTTPDFLPYRVPSLLSCQANRDINFLWSASYQTQFGISLPTADLDAFGIGIADTYKNPFNFPMTDIQLIHDYEVLRRAFRDSVYALCPATNGFRVNQPGYPDAERNHVDTYLYTPPGAGFPGDDPTGYGRWPASAIFVPDPDEDPGNPESSFNSISVPGPQASQVGVGGPNAWYRADGPISSIWNHEFQHDLNAFGGSYGEMYSSIAQTITGAPSGTNPYDVPYTWSLLANTFSHGGNNYNAWQSLGAYVAFDFRGADTTFTTRSDDLLWRWTMAAGTGSPSLTNLGHQLIDSRCTDCEAKFPAGVTSAKDRREVLVHNWRVYNYVDNPNLAQGQYGIPPNFGPSPSRKLGFWKDQDGCCWDNTIAIPPETTLTSSALSAVVTSTRTVSCPSDPCAPHAVLTVNGLDDYGAEYWIVRSDASLAQSGNTLKIKIEPIGTPSVSADRLMASVVGYSNSVDGGGVRTQLWTKPEWAQTVVGPQWFDVRSQPCGVINLSLPNFGTTNKAALVVITLGSSTEFEAGTAIAAQQFKLTMTVEPPASGCTPPAPTAVMTSPTISDMRGAFNPAGNEVVFMHMTPGLGDSRIYRKSLPGGTATQLVPGTPNGPQTTPDWSPRGDWVAYEQDTTSGDTHIWVFNVQTGEKRRLTNSSLYEVYPAFSPNGQDIAYSHGFQNGIDFVWEIRRVKLDGSSNTLVYACNNRAVAWPRWSPDGTKIYFTRGDSLYAVNAGGGQPIAIPKVAPTFLSFDPPLGKGPFVTEDDAVFCSGTHLALQDTVAMTRVYPFESNGWSLSRPRWAYDGIRLIYGAGPTGGDNDLYVASSSCNHAPVLAANATYDIDLFACSYYQRTISATDADGDPITYQAVSLPAGAAFIQGNKFRWTPSTSQQNQDFYVVFRALDNKGGVGQAVVKFHVVDECVVCPGPPYCLPEGLARQPVVDEDLPSVFMLAQNSPNPFSDETRIGFDVPRSSPVTINVYDIQGRLVRKLADRTYAPGHWSVTWNRQDSRGNRVPLGVYFYRARMGSWISEKKMLLLK